MFFQNIFLLLVLAAGIFQSQAYDYIKKWRNEKDQESVEFYKGYQVGLGDQVHRSTIRNPVAVASCIEEKRKQNRESEESGILYIDKAFEYFGLCFCKVILGSPGNCKATVDYSIPELQYRHYHRFHIRKTFGSIRYFEQKNLPEKKENIFVKTITNRGSKKVQSNAEITIVKTDASSTTASSEIGGSLGATVDIKAGIISFKASMEQSYSYTGGLTNKTEVKSTFALNRAFDIPPRSAVQIICSLKNQPFDLKWEIPVTISGAVAVKMKYTGSNEEYLFVNVKYIARFFKEFSLTKEDEPRLQTFIRGRTQGNKHYSAEVNPISLPLEETVVSTDICNPLPSGN